MNELLSFLCIPEIVAEISPILLALPKIFLRVTLEPYIPGGRFMSSFRNALSLLFLSLSLITPALAQTESKTNSSDIKDLAAALVRTKSEAEEDTLLTPKKELISTALLAELKALVEPFIQKGEYGEAARISHIAIRVAEQLGDRHALGVAMCDLGAIYARQMNKTKESLNYLQKSLDIFEEVGDKAQKARALHAIGITLNLERRFDLSLEYYEKSLPLSREVGDRVLEAKILNSLGLTHSAIGHFALGLNFYQQARALSEEVNDKATLHMALNNIATHYSSQGRFAEALDYLHRSLKIIEELGTASDRRSLAYKYQNIAFVYRHQGQLEQALVYAQKSLQILEEIQDKFGIANLYNNIGVINKVQKRYPESLEWFDKSLNLYDRLGATHGIARCLNNIGDVYRLQGRRAEALTALQKSLELREKNRDRQGIILSLNNLSRLYEADGKYAEMLAASTRSVQLAIEINFPEELWRAQDLAGKAQIALGKPAEARQSFQAAIKTLETLRRHVAGGEQQQQTFFEDKLSPWQNMTQALVAQRENAEALTVAEQSKARVLLDALQTGRANLRSFLSPEDKQAEEKLRLELVDLNSKLTNELRSDKSDPARVTDLKQALAKARLEYEDFETRLYAAHPALRVQRGEAPIIRKEELKGLLPDAASALLEYVVAEEQTYLFVVTKTNGKPDVDVQVYTLPVNRKELAQHTEAFRQQLARRDLGFGPAAVKLYEMLLKPAEEQLRGKTNLIISPDNTLWDLPFQALMTSADRYLIEGAAIAYTPSLTVLREMTKRREKQSAHANPATLLALGNPLVGNETMKRVALTLRDGKLDPLPEAEQEVKALGRLYGTTRSKVYIGAEAREDRVKLEASRARILHFATHGVLNNASPMYSHLALAEGGTGEDGLLEAWELMQLDLQADLAVLSACETARGRIGAGEGMIGFSWAMFIAGVPSIVVSQWKVESAGTRDLMVNFHRSLISPVKVTKSEALRQASLKLMRNPETRHPFYWAGFVLVGDGR